MRIVADENILALEELYRHFGEVMKLPGRAISPADLSEADVLLVRSITPVNAALLEGSPVRFVATATSGTDHLDLDYLHDRGITVAQAGGSNANAVVDYCFAALSELVRRGRLSLEGARVGIVGAGHVGGLLFRKLQALGIECRLYDPFVVEDQTRRRALSGSGVLPFCSLEATLESDIISFHTPLTRTGPHPTYHLLDAKRIGELRPGTVVMNTCRGPVVDNNALRKRLLSQDDLLTVFDVWEEEPHVPDDLLGLISLASPHIAGYSVEAKLKASQMNYQSFLEHFGLQDIRTVRVTETGQGARAGLEEALSGLLRQGAGEERLFAECVAVALSLSEIDRRFRDVFSEQPGAASFDQMRRELIQRRELTHYLLSRKEQSLLGEALSARLQVLGFGLGQDS